MTRNKSKSVLLSRQARMAFPTVDNIINWIRFIFADWVSDRSRTEAGHNKDK
jgi:hypothetical protein